MSSILSTSVSGTVCYGKYLHSFIIDLSDDEESSSSDDDESDSDDDGESASDDHESPNSESDSTSDNDDANSHTSPVSTAATSLTAASSPPTSPLKQKVDDLLRTLQTEHPINTFRRLETAVTDHLHNHAVTLQDVEILVPALKSRYAIINKLTTNIALHFVYGRIPTAAKDAILERLLTHASIRKPNSSWSDTHFDAAVDKIREFRKRRQDQLRPDPERHPVRWKQYERAVQNEARRERESRAEERQYAKRMAKFPERLRRPYELEAARTCGAASIADFYCGVWDLSWADVRQIQRQARAGAKKARLAAEEKTRLALETHCVREQDEEGIGVGMERLDAVSAGLFDRGPGAAIRVCIPASFPEQPLPPKPQPHPAVWVSIPTPRPGQPFPESPHQYSGIRICIPAPRPDQLLPPKPHPCSAPSRRVSQGTHYNKVRERLVWRCTRRSSWHVFSTKDTKQKGKVWVRLPPHSVHIVQR